MLLAAAAAMRMLWFVSLPLPAPAEETRAPVEPTAAGTGSPAPAVTLPPSPAPTATPDPTPAPTPTAAAPSAAIRVFTDAPEVQLKNDTSFAVDTAGLTAEPLTQTLPAQGPQILIVHTHGTEAYTAEPGREYEATDPYRTTDAEHSVIRVGEVLAEALRRQGLNVAHDTGLYDYPRYTGSYTRSEAAVGAWLERYPSIAVVIDLHRDAVGTDPAACRTLAAACGGAAQVMLVVGTGENGLAHPLWRENLKLAISLQRAMDAGSPTLTRPIQLVRERYNQHLTTGSLILEVGNNGNTLTEAERAVELFALAAGPVFLSLAGD